MPCQLNLSLKCIFGNYYPQVIKFNSQNSICQVSSNKYQQIDNITALFYVVNVSNVLLLHAVLR